MSIIKNEGHYFLRTGGEPTDGLHVPLTLKSQGWVNEAINDDGWNGEDLAEEGSDAATLLVKKSTLTEGFSDEGKLLAPVEFRIVGDMSACIDVFHAHALHAVMLDPYRISLQPEN